MLNLRKLEKIAFLAFNNALRLHRDSITLYKKGRYPSSFYFSVVSQEELGKMYMINDFVWNSRINGGVPDFEEDWLDLLYRHPHKQHAFLRFSPLTDQSYPKGVALMQEVFEGRLEFKKQMAIYVGLGRHRRKIDTKGRIRHPYQINKKMAVEQITKINDHLLDTAIGVRFTYYSLDHDVIENIIRHKNFINTIFRGWGRRSKGAIKRIRSMQKQASEQVINI